MMTWEYRNQIIRWNVIIRFKSSLRKRRIQSHNRSNTQHTHKKYKSNSVGSTVWCLSSVNEMPDVNQANDIKRTRIRSHVMFEVVKSLKKRTHILLYSMWTCKRISSIASHCKIRNTRTSGVIADMPTDPLLSSPVLFTHTSRRKRARDFIICSHMTEARGSHLRKSRFSFETALCLHCLIFMVLCYRFRVHKRHTFYYLYTDLSIVASSRDDVFFSLPIVHT